MVTAKEAYKIMDEYISKNPEDKILNPELFTTVDLA